MFDYLTLSATIDGRILCVHGGLSPDLRTLDQVRVIDRVCEIPHEGPFCDLMWSDPEEVDTWAVSPRGAGARSHTQTAGGMFKRARVTKVGPPLLLAGWLFGAKVTREFNHLNGLELICRAHQLVQVRTAART